MRAKVTNIVRMLTPSHPLLTGQQFGEGDEEAPTASLLQKAGLPPYEALRSAMPFVVFA